MNLTYIVYVSDSDTSVIDANFVLLSYKNVIQLTSKGTAAVLVTYVDICVCLCARVSELVLIRVC